MKKLAIYVSVLISLCFTVNAFSDETGGAIPVFEHGVNAPYATFLFDRTPVIESVVNTPLHPIAGQPVKVSAVVKQDTRFASMPVKEVNLHYSLDGGNTWTTYRMAQSEGDDEYYFAYIPSLEGGQKVVYYVDAIDTANSKTTEMPGAASFGKDGGKNLVSVTDFDEDDKTVLPDIDVHKLEVGYDEEHFYVRLEVEGKPGMGDMTKNGVYLYLMPLINLEDDKSAMEAIMDNTVLAYAPILKSYLGVDAHGIYKISEVMKTKKPIPGSDVKLKKGEHDLTFRFNRKALGENKNGKYEIIAITIAAKSIENMLPWEATPFLSFYLRNHGFTVLEKQPEAVAFKGGVAEADITPPVGTPLAGYGDRQGAPSEGVHDPLMVQALVLDADGEKVVFMTADLFMARRSLYLDVIKGIEEKTGIPRDHILISGSHSHSSSGALYTETSLLSGRFDPEIYKLTLDRFVNVAVEANSNLQPVKIGTGRTEAPGLMRNRNEDDGPKDEDLRVLRVDDMSGEPIAILFNYSAHPTVMGGDNREFSAEFPGTTRKELKKMYPGAIGMFSNGCLGNAGPSCPGDCGSGFDKIDKMGELMAGHIKRVVDEIGTKDKAEFTMISQEVLMHPDLNMWVTMSGLRLGDAAFLTIPGEMFVELGFPIKDKAKEMGFSKCFLMGLTNDGIGYIIPERWYHEHIYEAVFAIFGSREGEFIQSQLFKNLSALKQN
ncbi:MAG TPA: neutral/alkaline non-lysosomal ceramidase N-terminal domain-containing protein [bacterium]|nr:neutral/alkaline non-lysosomal ceramidase N-terminal domain-containing protein [bacterium]